MTKFPIFGAKGERKTKRPAYDTAQHIRTTIFEMVFYLLFLITATWVMVKSKPHDAMKFDALILRIFKVKEIKTDLSTISSLANVMNIDSWYDYMQTIFLEAYHKSTESYQDYLENVDQLNKLALWYPLGIFRIRQVRVREERCERLYKKFRDKFRRCYDVYSRHKEYVARSWKNTRYIVNETTSFRGLLADYNSPGYEQLFHLEFRENLRILNSLRSTEWIDSGTRLIIIDVSMFSTNEKLISQLKLFFEFPKLGAVIPSTVIHSFQIFTNISELKNGMTTAFIICLVLLVYTLVYELLGLIDSPRKYFANIWNLVDWAILISGFLFIWALIKRSKAAATVLDRYKQSKDWYVNLDDLIYYEETYRYLLSCTVFCLWIKLFKFIGCNNYMKYISNTTKRCAFELFNFIIIYVIVLLAFAEFGYLLFGQHLPEFQTFESSMRHIINFSLARSDMAIMKSQYDLKPSISVCLFYFLFIVMMNCIIMNIFLVIMYYSYKNIRTNHLQNFEAINIGTYIMNCFRKKGHRINLTELGARKKAAAAYKENEANLIPRFFEILQPPEMKSIDQKIAIKRGEKKLKTATYENSKQIRHALFDFIIYLGFLISATYVMAQSKPHYAKSFNKNLMFNFEKREKKADSTYVICRRSIVNIATWFEYMEVTFLDGYHKNRESYDSFRNESILPLALWYPMGVFRIRQVRVRNETCKVYEPFKKHFPDCYGPYTSLNEYHGSNWKNTTLISNESSHVKGYLATYKTAGFGQSFQVLFEDNVRLLRHLRETDWVDSGTRLLIIELSLFSTNEGLISQLKFFFEFPQTGAVMSSYYLRTFRAPNVKEVALKAALIACGIFVIYTILDELIGIADSPTQYFKSYWNYVDLLIIISAVFAYWSLLARTDAFKEAAERFHYNRNWYISLDEVVYYEENYRYLVAIVVVCLWIKLFKFIGFNKPMKYFLLTVQKCGNSLICFAIMYLLVFIAFAQLGYLIFGQNLFAFRSFADAIVTMVILSMHPYDTVTLQQYLPISTLKNPFTGYVFFIFYIVAVYFILLSMFLVIMIDTYSRLRRSRAVYFEESFLGLYLKNMFKRKSKRVNIDELAREQIITRETEKRVLPKLFEVVQPAEPTAEDFVESLQTRIKKNEDLLSKLSRGLDGLQIQLKIVRKS